MTDMHAHNVVWPEGKRFAFTVFDDTDDAVLSEVREVYALLLDHGMTTTKTAWMFDSSDSCDSGDTCERSEYLDWLRGIQDRGVEIAWHNPSHESSERGRISAGLSRFAELFDDSPRSYACHSQCRENIYWGPARLSSPLNRTAYNLLTRFRKVGYFQGHFEDSRWFWGDICKEKIDYVRNFVFSDINTLGVCPFMPYFDPQRPFVNAWFAGSDGGDVSSFLRCISEKNQDVLEERGGACIMYTHFGRGFAPGGVLQEDFARLVERLSRKGGWFVPVAILLDHLTKFQGVHVISDAERNSLERRWLSDRLRCTLHAGFLRGQQ